MTYDDIQQAAKNLRSLGRERRRLLKRRETMRHQALSTLRHLFGFRATAPRTKPRNDEERAVLETIRKREEPERKRISRLAVEAQKAIEAVPIVDGEPDLSALDPKWIELGIGVNAVLEISNYADLRKFYDTLLKAQEKKMIAIVRQLPIHRYVCGEDGPDVDVETGAAKGIRGVGELTLAKLIGECGSLDNYPKKGHVWKRMGVAVINGERQRRVAGNPELAALHGYDAERHSDVWNLADNIVKQGRHYRVIYNFRKLIEKAKVDKKTGELITPKHADNRARRWVAKLILKHIWQQWKRYSAAADGAPPSLELPRTPEAQAA